MRLSTDPVVVESSLNGSKQEYVHFDKNDEIQWK